MAKVVSAAARGRPEVGPSGGPSGAAAPSIGQQKTFIIENAGILNRETKLAILAIVMMEIGPGVIMETGGTREIDVDLDAVTLANEEVIAHIYNIVLTRREALNQPAGAPGRPEPACPLR
jgi:hypothetical protein